VLTLPRSAVLKFRMALRRTVMFDALRNTWPTVVCSARRGELMLEASQGGFAVLLSIDAGSAGGALAFRGDVLARFEGRDDALVTLESVGLNKGVARWTDGGVPQSVELDTVPVEDIRLFLTSRD
jgi:hypothetical protein